MRNIYLGIVVVATLSSWSAPVVLAAADFSLPVSDPDNWFIQLGSDSHYGKSLFALDFNRKESPYADEGKPVFAVADGTVFSVERSPDSGGRVKINHPDNLRSAYHHLDYDTITVKVGDKVEKGQPIGKIGSDANNGSNASTPHLHFAVYKLTIYGKGSAVESAYDLKGIKVFDDIPRIGTATTTIKTKIPDFSPTEPLKEIALQPIVDMVNKFYEWALGIGTGVAMGIVIYGGILYITAVGNPSKQTEAKAWIKSAIYGLLLLLLSYLLLYTINPAIVGVGG